MRIRPLHLVDIFVYLVVLGLFTQFFPQVISETFVFSLLTAILLKIVLEIVLKLKKQLLNRFRDSVNIFSKVVSVASLILVLPGSKFVVLELVAFAFGDSVQLGGFFQVTALIIALMFVRGLVRRSLESSDDDASESRVD